MKMLLVLLTLGLSACAISKQVPLPNGENGYSISACRDMAMCYRKAADVCGGKYQIVNQSSAVTGSATPIMGAMSTSYTLTITCL